jgi:hypothetical protein
MMLRVFDAFVHWTSGHSVVAFLVIAALGWAMEVTEMRRGRASRTKEMLLE